MTDIKTKRAALKKRMLKLCKDIEDLQTLCTHPNATHTNKANTGNYDPSADSYWTEHKCPDCEHYWQTDQDWDRK
jgi:hypothetical protein